MSRFLPLPSICPLSEKFSKPSSLVLPINFSCLFLILCIMPFLLPFPLIFSHCLLSLSMSFSASFFRIMFPFFHFLLYIRWDYLAFTAILVECYHIACQYSMFLMKIPCPLILSLAFGMHHMLIQCGFGFRWRIFHPLL